MEISASLVRELREKTGLGMMDCKKALNETNGDLDQAIDFLRKKGALKAEGKSDRITSEGVIGSYVSEDGRVGTLIEINCETDFVARNEDFVQLVKDIAYHVSQASSLDNVVEQPFVNDSSKTIGDMIKEKIAKIGENMNLKRCLRYATESNGVINSYIHFGSKVGVLVEFTSDSNLDASNEHIVALVKDVALHITASKPQFVGREDVDPNFIAKEREILMAQPDLASKPDNIKEKMVTGRLDKVYSQSCLLEQAFVKNPDQTISDVLKAASSKIGANVTVKRFSRYALGEEK